MLKVYYRILVSAWKTFGFSMIFLRWALLVPIFILFTQITLFLDNIFFPQYRQCQVKKPVFIIGHPRSGNSFLHHLLTQTNEFVAFQTWEILIPALTGRVLLKPLFNFLVTKQDPSLIPDEVGHGVAWNKVEEEELLFFHKLDTQFVWARTPLGFDEQDHPEFRFNDLQPSDRRQSSVRFFKGCLQRQMYYTGKERAILQTLQSVMRIKTLLEIFPDAKFIYIVRSPYETIPSHLSVLWYLLDYQIGIKNLPPEAVQQYFKKRYSYNIELYRYFYDLQKNNQISEDNVLVVRYEQLRSELEPTVEKIVNFAELELSEELKKAIKEQAQNQSKYKRKHQFIDLEQFDITKAKITQDFDFVFQEYGFEPESVKIGS